MSTIVVIHKCMHPAHSSVQRLSHPPCPRRPCDAFLGFVLVLTCPATRPTRQAWPATNRPTTNPVTTRRIQASKQHILCSCVRGYYIPSAPPLIAFGICYALNQAKPNVCAVLLGVTGGRWSAALSKQARVAGASNALRAAVWGAWGAQSRYHGSPLWPRRCLVLQSWKRRALCMGQGCTHLHRI